MGYLVLVLVLGRDVLVPIKKLTAKLHNKSFKSHIHVTCSHHMVCLANTGASSTLDCIVTSD